jgi:spore coat assembly protein
MDYGIRIGDLVGRRSYNLDILFRVMDIYSSASGEEMAVLKGIDYRLLADAPLADLVKPSKQRVEQDRDSIAFLTDKRFERRKREQGLVEEQVRSRNVNDKLDQYDFFGISGKVLHLDGDKDYLVKCIDKYKELKVEVIGEAVEEKEQPQVVLGMLRRYRPDILVLTGHDGIKKGTKDFDDLENYHSSKYFVEAVKQARLFEKGRDELIIFAGACHSHFPSLIRAGANYASSPQRVVIHCYDPVLVAEKLANSSVRTTVPVDQIIANTLTGIAGVGGIETKGKFRLGLPVF